MTAPAASAEPERFHRLDGLRALWVVGVMAHHLEYTFKGWAEGWFPGGWLPVDGFFVLSGFLLGGALVGERERFGRISYGRFLARRLGRLYPALAVMVAAMAAFALLADARPWAEVWPSVVGPLAYVCNLFYSTDLALLPEAGHLWSLCVEFQFYLVLPLLVGGLLRFRIPRLGWAVLLIGAAVASAWARRSAGTGGLPEVYVDLPWRLDALLWGVLASVAVRWGWVDRRWRLPLRVLGPIAAAVLAWMYLTVGGFDAEAYAWAITTSGVCSAVVVLWIFLDAQGLPARVLGSRLLVAAGARSYSAYLWHFPIFFALANHQPDLGAWPRSILALALTVVASDLSFRLVERPVMRWSARFRSTAGRFGPTDTTTVESAEAVAAP